MPSFSPSGDRSIDPAPRLPASPGQRESPRSVVDPPQISGHLSRYVGFPGARETDHDYQELPAFAVPLVKEVRLWREVAAARIVRRARGGRRGGRVTRFVRGRG